MELAILLYVASVAENLRSGLGFFQVVFFLLGLGSAIATGGTAITCTEKTIGTNDFKTMQRANRLLRRTFIVSFFSWAAVTLVIHLMPVRRDVYVMAGGYVALKAVHSNVVQATADGALNSIEKWLDKEMTADKKEAASKKDNSKKERK